VKDKPRMTPEARPDSDLRAVVYLLERAGSYRAVSARTALVGGVLSLAVSGTMLAEQTAETGRNVDARTFFHWWSLVFIATLAAGAFFLRREAQRRGEPLVSAGLKLALASMAPGLFAGGAIGGCLTLTSGLPLFPALFWLVFYGLALLALRPFAPRAMIVLGWAFLITGVGAFIYLMNETMMPDFDLPTPTNLYPAAIMGAAFGGYHVVYAACMWRRR
jgi:hypothetical protein